MKSQQWKPEQLNLRVKNQIDVRWTDDLWYIAIIIDINNQQIKIHYQCEGDDNTSDEWINKTSNRIAKLNRYTHVNHIISIMYTDDDSLLSVSIELTNCPIKYPATKAIYYKHNEHEYILYCVNQIQSIYRYDIKNNNWDKLSDYPSNFHPLEKEAICFNKTKSKVYLFSLSSIESTGTMATYNVQKDTWNLKKCMGASTYDDSGSCNPCSACFIEYPQQTIHLFCLQTHWKIIDDGSKDECNAILLSDFPMGFFLNGTIWCDEFQALIMIAIQTNKSGKHPVCFCKITQPNQSQYNWQFYGSTAIFDNRISFELILAFKHILFVFTPIIYCGSTEYNLWCVDLLYHQKFWVAKVDNLSSIASIIKTDDNYLHYIDSTGIKTDEMHYKISLFDLIPLELNDLYHVTLSDPLVFGYIAEMNKSNQLSNCIPIDVAYIILEFFPPLL
eukprot:37631_1